VLGGLVLGGGVLGGDGSVGVGEGLVVVVGWVGGEGVGRWGGRGEWEGQVGGKGRWVVRGGGWV
jgi:hypothetical protein